MDLHKFNFSELLALKSEIENEIKQRAQEEKTKAKKQIMELVKAHGLSLEDVLAKGAGRKPVEAKYQHPKNASLTWSGRGRKPVWVQELLSAGKNLKDLAIK